jgi:hypothetical protein
MRNERNADQEDPGARTQARGRVQSQEGTRRTPAETTEGVLNDPMVSPRNRSYVECTRDVENVIDPLEFHKVLGCDCVFMQDVRSLVVLAELIDKFERPTTMPAWVRIVIHNDTRIVGERGHVVICVPYVDDVVW